jgi:hypothetical protein
VDVTMILCDAADTVGGKLYVLGGGWTHLLSPGQPVNMALGVIIAVPWDETNRKHALQVVLLNEDGEQVTQGDDSVENGGHIAVGRPLGVKPGSAINTVFAFRFNGLVLDVGGYVWELRLGAVQARTPFWVIDPSEGVLT